MTDQIVRTAFHQKILKKAHLDTHTFVVDELGLKNGEIRADIAVLNGKLVGYEIKTEKDNLNRLASQVVAYNEVFDQAFIVTGEKHLAKVYEIIPAWWGIYIIQHSKDDQIKFKCIRKSKTNRVKKSYGIAQLLWKPEVIDILQTNATTIIKTKTTKHELYEVLSNCFDPYTLGLIALNYLKTRKDWRTSH